MKIIYSEILRVILTLIHQSLFSWSTNSADKELLFYYNSHSKIFVCFYPEIARWGKKAVSSDFILLK